MFFLSVRLPVLTSKLLQRLVIATNGYSKPKIVSISDMYLTEETVAMIKCNPHWIAALGITADIISLWSQYPLKMWW